MGVRKSASRFILILSLIVGISTFQLGNIYAQDEQAATEASAGGLSTDPSVIANGKSIFEANCAQCHAVHEQVVGPKLAGVYERQSVEWLINFIKYPEKTIASGDEHAVELYKKYKQYMPNHDFLKDEEITSILSYIQEQTKIGVPEKKVSIDPRENRVGAAAGPGVNPNLLLVVIGGLVVLLVALLAVMILLLGVLSKHLSKKDDLTEEDEEFLTQRFQPGKLLSSTPFMAVATFAFVLIAGKLIIDGLFSVGVQQGYAPDQPIKFSHKLHAGYYEIDCKYCHTGVEKSKSANIPSPNICMNCHNTIRTNSPEIQKIYKAIETNEPIQWVRVHNLPDLAYFNHSQHVKVGGIECETCHGNIKEMEVVQQFSLLTMGWCIACHEKTEVRTADNGYYDKLVKLHAENSKKPMTVENIGGLECSKCHY